MKKITIEFGGKERDFHFGLGFIGELFQNTDVTLSNMGEKVVLNPFKYMPTIMFYSLQYAERRRGVEPDFTLYDVFDWFEEAKQEDIDAFFVALRESLTKDVPVEKATEKKKVTKK